MAPRDVYLPPINRHPTEIAKSLFHNVSVADEDREAAIGLRNRHWEHHPLIPQWVEIETVDLDRYFTQPEVAMQCYVELQRVMEADHADLQSYCFVEPGAGQGAFYDLLPPGRRIGIDLVPGHPEYEIGDYLSWQPKTNGRRYAVIGNPPFGYRGWLALAFMNHSAMFADYIGMILPMSFQSDGKGSPKHRAMGVELIQQSSLPADAFTNEDGQAIKINALWQVWRRGVNNRPPTKTCDQWIDLFTVDVREERLCGHERKEEATWFLQRTFYGDPPKLVKQFSDVKYGCGYGIVIKQQPRKITRTLAEVDWRKYSNLAMHNCSHISMYHIRQALMDAGFVDV